MTRIRSFTFALFAVALIVFAAACNSSSSDSSTTVGKNDVAVVGDRTITVDQLNNEIKVRLASMKAQGQNPPKPGTSTYQTEIVQASVTRLVQLAQLANIAANMHINVTSDDVNKQLQQVIKQYFKGSHSKFEAYLKKNGLTDQYVRDEIELPSIQQQKVVDALKKNVNVTSADVKKYYETNKAQYAPQRQVLFLLAGSKAAADAAHSALAGGADWTKTAKKYAIAPGPPSTGGTFTATDSPGAIEDNFRKAVFSSTLKTGTLSDLILVSKSYADSNLKGKCKPNCYFIVKPTADTKQQTFKDVASQIKSQLESQQQQTVVQAKIAKLQAAQQKLTHYNKTYKPPSTSKPSTSTPTT
jgi:peptidyl-prolyl cis-trans isomerase SurA